MQRPIIIVATKTVNEDIQVSVARNNEPANQIGSCSATNAELVE